MNNTSSTPSLPPPPTSSSSITHPPTETTTTTDPPVAREAFLPFDPSQYVQAVRNGEEKGAIPIVCFVMFLILPLGIATMVVANLVFAIQGLSLGRKYYQASATCNSVIGTWMLVYGSLVVCTFVLSCCCTTTVINEEGHRESRRTLAGSLSTLTAFVNAGWVCYGFSIASTDPSLPKCDPPSLFDTFHLMTYFLFYGSLALAAHVVLCCLCLVFMVKTETGNGTTGATSVPDPNAPYRDNPDVPKASIVTTPAEGATSSVAQPEVYLAEVDDAENGGAEEAERREATVPIAATVVPANDLNSSEHERSLEIV